MICYIFSFISCYTTVHYLNHYFSKAYIFLVYLLPIRLYGLQFIIIIQSALNICKWYLKAFWYQLCKKCKSYPALGFLVPEDYNDYIHYNSDSIIRKEKNYTHEETSLPSLAPFSSETDVYTFIKYKLYHLINQKI